MDKEAREATALTRATTESVASHAVRISTTKIMSCAVD